jgi:spore germination protein
VGAKRSAAIGIAAIVAAAVIGAAALTTPHTEKVSTTTAPLQVVGYADAYATTSAQLDASARVLTTVGVDGINLLADGTGVEDVSPAASALLAKTHALGKKAELLVGNFDGERGDFSPEIAASMLDSDDNIAGVVSDLKTIVTDQGWDGVTVDLEALTADDIDGLSAFLVKLRAALPDSSISVAISATPGDYAELGYDLHVLDETVDHVVLMAYDQHGPTWSKAGAVGGTPWVTKSLRSLLDVVHASRVQLGVAGYGYTWPHKGSGTQVSDARARVLVKKSHVKPTWDATQQEWHARLSSGTVIWWSDARTYAARKALATKYHLGGVAVWALGLSDPLK